MIECKNKFLNTVYARAHEEKHQLNARSQWCKARLVNAESEKEVEDLLTELESYSRRHKALKRRIDILAHIMKFEDMKLENKEAL